MKCKCWVQKYNWCTVARAGLPLALPPPALQPAAARCAALGGAARPEAEGPRLVA